MNHTRSSFIALETIEPVLGIIGRIFPDVIVPTFMDVVTKREQICPGSIIIRGLEFGNAFEDSLVSDITHEPFDLSHHSYVASFEANSNEAFVFNL
jgi:hypothetical protein